MADAMIAAAISFFQKYPFNLKNVSYLNTRNTGHFYRLSIPVTITSSCFI